MAQGYLFLGRLCNKAESLGLAPLRDARQFANAILVEGEGLTVAWPELDIQIGADTLWLAAQAQNSKDNKVMAEYIAMRSRTLSAKHLALHESLANTISDGI
ncbi:hypothetical protein [Macromonas bipunctata]|uniref:hypothetical protein n=1 Tax=Macromonas bipunctata TaxID=183670 RepID=UPI000C338822|nr:hypothetical protein [Macromonas bipunctata]